MNKIQTSAFLAYYNGAPIDVIRKELHKSERTINKWIIEFEFDRLCAERSQQVMDQTANEMIAVKLDIIKIIKNSITRKYTQTNVWGEPVNSIGIESAKDLQALSDVITKLDGTGTPKPVVVNVGDRVDTVNVSDDVLKALGRKLASEDETD